MMHELFFKSLYESYFKDSEYQFEYSSDIEDCDVAVVLVEGGWNNIKFKTNAKRKIAFLYEPKHWWPYDSSFLDQFTDVVSSYGVADCKCKFHFTCQCHNFYIGYDSVNHTIDVEEFNKTINNSKKSKLISAICSNKVQTEYHRKRQEFLNKLKEDLPELDCFGKSVDNPITYKDEALRDYKFTIAIENGISLDYWTEKISDPILALTQPIYCGAQNINSYFKEIDVIDINDYDRSLITIKKVIEKGYDQHKMIENRKILLSKYNIEQIIVDVLENKID